MTKALRLGADTRRESARQWYDSYGAHVETSTGDIELQTVEYDDLEGGDAAIVASLMRDVGLSRPDARALVCLARETRDAAEAVCDRLDAAVRAYEEDDLDGVVSALDEAEAVESPHGASPATDRLRAQLLDDESRAR